MKLPFYVLSIDLYLHLLICGRRIGELWRTSAFTVREIWIRILALLPNSFVASGFSAVKWE